MTMETNMTVFYSKATGKVKACCGGVQTMDYFGEDQNDYNYGFIVVDYDLNVILNTQHFVVKDNRLIYAQVQAFDASKYM